MHSELRSLWNGASREQTGTKALTFGEVVCAPVSEEALSAWQQLAGRASALLQAADRVWHAETPAQMTWLQAEGYDWSQVRAGEPSPGWLSDPWARVAQNLNWWLDMTQVAPVMTRGQNGIELRYQGLKQGLLGRIAVDLVFAVSKFEGLFTCAGCGNTFPVRRAMRAGTHIGRGFVKRDYCTECQRSGQPHRDAARDYYARKKLERQMSKK